MGWNTVSLDRNGGKGGPATLYYYASNGLIRKWSRSEGGAQITSITVPTRECYAFSGYKVTSATKNKTYWVGSNCVSSSGACLGLQTGGDMAATAQWTQVSRKITFKTNGGGYGTDWRFFAYVKINGGGIYEDDQCTIPLPRVGIPEKEGSLFLGYFYTTSGESKYVNADGTWAVNYETVTIARDITLYANWRNGGYKITFDRKLGTGGPDAIYLDGENNAW